MAHKCFFLLIVFLHSFLFSQELNESIQKELNEIDTINSKEFNVEDTIALKGSNIYHLKLKTDLEKKYYIWLRKRVRDVWPYVKVAVEEYNLVEDSARYIFNNRERKKYIKARQRKLADKFEARLKKLSQSRGQILIKLIHRETDETTYQIIKKLRGGMSAFLWNSAGGAFDLNLKEEFNPYATREDLYIEVILRRDFSSGRLQPINKLID